MNHRTLLHIFLVLTFCFAGLSAIAYLSIGIMQPMLANYYANYSDLFPSEVYATLERFFDAPQGFYIISAILYLLEVVGAALMWKLRTAGFHCYTIARLLLLLVPLLFLGRGTVGLGDIMFALLYIGLYFYLLRQLSAFNHPHHPTDQSDCTD